MATARPSEKQLLAARAWRRLFEVFMRTRGQRDQVLERFALTPNDAKALGTLEPEPGTPMRVLADRWGTDASNATWVVDRLERLGLVERRPVAHDRRVKLVALTARGAKVRDDIMRAFHEPPPELLQLDAHDLRVLADTLAKVTAAAGAPAAPVLDSAIAATKRGGRRRSPKRRKPTA